MRIVDLASKSEVSEPTVIRFCKAIGFDGFQSFKLQLAQQLGLGSVFTQFAVEDNDTVADLINKVFDTTVGSLITAREEINSEVLEQAITTISNARRVEFYGFGASGSVAADAQHKFFRLQLSSAAYTMERHPEYIATGAFAENYGHQGLGPWLFAGLSPCRCSQLIHLAKTNCYLYFEQIVMSCDCFDPFNQGRRIDRLGGTGGIHNHCPLDPVPGSFTIHLDTYSVLCFYTGSSN